ncbi:relaxase domain-containing protein [Leptolyngbya sp. PL-A3]|uniref:relaxase domain-containing protein n=1 Tax=Leptolyngbya sp. PL-A3 TaxID=2933911 RepID=UPI0032993F47
MTCSETVVHVDSGYEHYFLRYHTVGSVTHDAEYGKALGFFAGSGAEALGLNHQPIYENDIRVKRLYRGESPITGEVLRRGMTTTRTYTDKEKGNSQKYKPVSALELCFSAPGDTSTFFATTRPENRSRMLQALWRSLPLEEIQSKFCFTRTGPGGTHREAAQPIFACFTHSTNRNSDPQLHVHVQLFSTVLRVNGRGGALDTSYVYLWCMSKGEETAYPAG